MTTAVTPTRPAMRDPPTTIRDRTGGGWTGVSTWHASRQHWDRGLAQGSLTLGSAAGCPHRRGREPPETPSRTLLEQSACWLPSRLRQDPRRYQPQQGLAFPVGSRDDGWKIVTTSRPQPRRERSCVGWRAPVNGPSGVDARSRWIPSPNRVHRLPQVSQPHVRERPPAVPHMFQSCCVRCCKPWN